MPIPSDSFASLDDIISRLAGESILAQPGRDEGLIPAYSLLGELCELSAAEPALNGPVTALRAALEKLLDAAKPFDDASLTALRKSVDWLVKALAAVKVGHAIPPAPIAAKMQKATSEAMESPGLRDELQTLSAVLVAPERRSSAYLGQFVKTELVKWGDAMKAGGVIPK